MTAARMAGLRDASYRSVQRALARRGEVNWPLLALVILFIGYWIFVWALMRVNGDQVVARWLLRGTPPGQWYIPGMLPFLALLAEFFNWRVLLCFVPLLIGWRLATEAAVSLIQVLYDCPDRETARDFLSRHRRRSGTVVDAPVEITPETLDSLRKDSVLLRVGGSTSISVPGGHAVVTELNSRFSRVLGPGTHQLGHYEYIQAIINIQNQERAQDDVPLVTKEGIPLRTSVGVSFRVDPGEELSSHGRPYPFTDAAVEKVAYAQTVSGGARPSGWESAPLGRSIRELSSIVSQWRLDELIVPGESTEEPHSIIRRRAERAARAKLKEQGILLNSLVLGRLAPPNEATQQYIDFWLANWRKRNHIARASGTAVTVQELEVARAEAEVTMLHALVEGLNQASSETDGDDASYVLALSLVDALDKMTRQSSPRLASGAAQGEQLTAQLARLREQLARLEPAADRESSSAGHRTPFIPSRGD
jgi:hypothetical protein